MLKLHLLSFSTDEKKDPHLCRPFRIWWGV